MEQLIVNDVRVILGQFFSESTEEEILCGWFQQDSASAHTARMSMQASSDVFLDRIISSDIWPACSPDLNPCDFFFWHCLKYKVYSSNPRMEEELKENLCSKILNIPAEHLHKVNENLFHWCKEYLCVEGQHSQHLL
jgi:inhibitor of nuclear factor kappa-B kinase subunit alpha